jgi:arylsulfatase A-like enzyme
MADRVNLVLAVLDTARAAETLDLAARPGLRDLAAGGTVFRRAISPAPWTLPAHGSLFSGLLPHEHGLTGDAALPGGVLHPVGHRVEALAERWVPLRLQRAGYRTFATSANPWITPKMGFALGFERFVEGWRAAHNLRFRAEGDGRASRARHLPPPVRRALRAARRQARDVLANRDSGAAASLQAFQEWLKERDRRPFFAFFNFMEPHLPYRPPRPFGPSRLRSRLAAARLNGVLGNEFVVRYNAGRADLSAEDLFLLRELYDGEIGYLDSRLADLAEEVARAEGEALLVVVGDHGENLGEHHLLGHQASLADTLLRVPLVMAGPSELAGRGEVAEPVSTARVAGTFARAAGLPSLGPTLADGDPGAGALSWYESAYQEAAGARSLADGELAGDRRARQILTARGWAVHRGPHKLIVWSDGRRELYDVESDPGETRDLAPRSPKMLEAFADLTLPLEPSSSQAPEAARGELEEIERHLESLGYL